MSKITLKDIALKLKISTSTVSRALNDHPNISEAMKEKVKEAAETLGYEINYQTGYFRPRKNKLIGLIVHEIGRFFIPDMISEIEKTAKKKGYNFIIFQSHDLLETEKECAILCQNFRLDGLLVSLTKETKSIKHFDFFLKNDIPIVFVDKVPKSKKVAKVMIDDFKAASIAVRYLGEKGYKKIAGIFVGRKLMITKNRKKGFKESLKKMKLKYYENFCFHAESHEHNVKEDFIEILSQKERPDAVFAMTDGVLAKVIEAIREVGLKIPEDIAVIAISNGYLPTYISPNITHIKHSGKEVGKEAANYLVDLIEHPKGIETKERVVPISLELMDSC